MWTVLPPQTHKSREKSPDSGLNVGRNLLGRSELTDFRTGTSYVLHQSNETHVQV
jgi:hypothetical protein